MQVCAEVGKHFPIQNTEELQGSTILANVFVERYYLYQGWHKVCPHIKTPRY